MKLISFLALFLLVGCPLLAQEVILASGTSLALRITGVPAEDQQNITGNYTISDNGTIRLPYINAVKASGLRPSALAARIESAYRSAQIYTKPTVNVSASSGAVERFVSFLGEVKAARTVPYSSAMTVVDAVAQCGGWSDFANRREVKVIRGKTTKILDLRRTDSTDNMVLQPGDKIVVMQKGFFGNKR